MWIFRRHRHLPLEVLSEYLDGRLRGKTPERVARELESCATCREELESLGATVSLLQRLPQTPPRRSFTLPAPPPAPTAASLPVPLRMPNWVYAGAASLAGLALVVLVSTDATGLLAPDRSAAQPEASIADQRQPEGEPPADSTALTATQTPGVEAAAPPEGEALTNSTALKTEAGAPDEATTPGTAGGTSEQAQVGESVSFEVNIAQQEGTALVWRVLEGVAAALGLGLVFLIGLVYKWRASRRVNRA